MSAPVLVSREGAVATLTLNRPDALNALDDAMIDALVDAATSIAAETAIRVVVLRGAGRHFMAGGDIRVFAQSLDLDAGERAARFRGLVDRVHTAIETIARMPQPVIAAVQGAVAGFGLSLANACDLVYASDDAYFASAYLTIGVTPDGGGTWSLPRIVGARKAAEIMLLGERFDARRAAELGIVNRVVPAAELAATIEAVAARIAEGPRTATQSLKRLLRLSSQTALAGQLDLEAQSFSACTAGEEFAEGVRAFLAKRKPDFSEPST